MYVLRRYARVNLLRLCSLSASANGLSISIK